ncbi:winged helix-turn-helix domain-containing protein [Holospora elegans]|nr:winged helix-turn-helix domain-containing protein [Holospora elegans]
MFLNPMAAIQGKTLWLHAHNFSFKKPAARPAKADPAKQKAFIHYFTRR